jgi:hypothetical protein
MLLEHKGEGVWENTTNEFKCKDYFNDFVIYKHTGHSFSAHGMRSNWVKFDPNGGLYILTKNVSPTFEQNILNVIIPEFGKTWGVGIVYMPLTPQQISDKSENCAVLHLNSECFVSTYRISVIMQFLRMCSVPALIPDYDTRLDRSLLDEGGWGEDLYKTFRDRKYALPEADTYSWYIGKEYNPTCRDVKTVSEYTLHDNGLVSWANVLIPVDWAYYDSCWITKIPYLEDGYYKELTDDEYDEEWNDEEELCEEDQE